MRFSLSAICLSAQNLRSSSIGLFLAWRTDPLFINQSCGCSQRKKPVYSVRKLFMRLTQHSQASARPKCSRFVPVHVCSCNDIRPVFNLQDDIDIELDVLKINIPVTIEVSGKMGGNTFSGAGEVSAV